MVEASWQPDPDDGGRLRWWDGTRWTEHVAPGPEGQEVGAAPMRTTAGPPVSPGLAPATEEDGATEAGTEAAEPTPDRGTAAEAAEAAGGAGAQPEDTPRGAYEQAAPSSGGVPAPQDDHGSQRDQATQRSVWTASGPRDRPDAEPSGTRAEQQPAEDEPPGPSDGARRSATHQTAPEVGRSPTPTTGAGPVWSVGPASGADDRSARPFVTARAVHRIIAAVGVVMLVVASVQMIALRSVSGDSVAEAFYNALGWGLLGATIWGACIYSMREIDAERAAARDRARADGAGRGSTS